jgi:phosphoribosyl-AMP cyclohydrolase
MNRARLVANYQRLMKSELDCDEGIVQVALIEADHLVCYLKKKVPAAVLPW